MVKKKFDEIFKIGLTGKTDYSHNFENEPIVIYDNKKKFCGFASKDTNTGKYFVAYTDRTTTQVTFQELLKLEVGGTKTILAFVCVSMWGISDGFRETPVVVGYKSNYSDIIVKQNGVIFGIVQFENNYQWYGQKCRVVGSSGIVDEGGFCEVLKKDGITLWVGEKI